MRYFGGNNHLMSRLSAAVWPQTSDVRLEGCRWDTAARGFAMIAVVVWAAVAGVFHSKASDEAAARAQQNDTGQTARAPATPPTREMMVGAYGGAPYTYPSTVNLKKGEDTDFTVEGVEWKGEPFIDPIYYGVRVQRWFEGGRTGAMLDFTHSKTIARLEDELRFSGTIDGAPVPEKAKLGEIFRRLEFSHGHNMLTLNALLRLPDFGARLSPYIGLGFGINLPHTEIQLIKGGRRTYEYQYTGPVTQALIGIEFRVPRMSYFVEYKFTLASYLVPLSELDGTKIGLFADLYRQAANWWSGEPPPGGDLETRLTSHQVIGGLGVRFGAASATAAPAGP